MEETLLKVQHAITWAVFGTLAAGLTAMWLYFRKERREGLHTIARELGGTVAGSFIRGRCIQVRTFGALQRIAFTETAGEIPRTCLTLYQQTDLDFPLDIVRETLAGRAAQKMGLAGNAKTGDRAFDEKYRIKTGSPEKAVRFLDSPERKRIVDQFFEQDFKRITIRKGEVSILLEGCSEDDEDASLLRRRLDMLMRFVSGEGARGATGTFT